MPKQSNPPGTGKSGKKNTSLRLDNKTLKALKIIAIENDTSVQKIIEELVKKYLNEAKAK
ncbi:MAG: ribbon-helix-helix protein, CopG family [Gammaproteobacteria bacterium]|jgi:predicted DNA-binding ribbon-helix-helix protein|nr:ribbon-helix-helix protein, CopG family [Gammaproteobacteria bacterium]MBT3721787.1 ribbon-helix-helix protein, CopG family [Gammaproteobacteria bacterium]MBT4077034.1 ribbon-helix-helix protein, CopG family [Gammaproteobacteria bacterium]MBT4192899.1 ribbon-helix-helix protein, CopG family [Gammaproteobacteria bacterium]MBT4450089.1 ribbon-helix-helix protein, CopG family [Gammaproteobacteria bacterium]